IRVWEAATGKLVHELAGHSNPLAWILFSPDGRRLATATGGADPSIRMWDMASGQELHDLEGPAEYPASIAWSTGGGPLAASGTNADVKLFDAASGAVVRSIATPLAGLLLAFAPDGKSLFGAAGDKLATWSLETGQLVRQSELAFRASSVTPWPGRDLVAM